MSDDSDIGDAIHRRRYRTLGAVAVVAAGLVGVAYLVDVRANSGSSTSPAGVALGSATLPDPPTDTAPAASLPPAAAPATTDPAIGLPAEFLDHSTEVYRRSLTDRDVVVRRGDLSWADFFDLEWRAPTGSADLCMGDHALIVGTEMADEESMRPIWTAIEVFDDFEGELAVEMDQFGLAVVRTSGSADEVAIVADGIEHDRTGFVNSLAVLDVAAIWAVPSGPTELVVVTFSDGVPGDPIPFAPEYGRPTEEYQQECTPGPAPMLPLPPAGEQPLDPLAAEAQILDAYARALDRSVLLPDEDPPSVDDFIGIPEAAAEVDAGAMADVAATAEHTVDELVFTAPDEAWFRYTITTSIGVATGQYGIARFNGQVWQITRDTLCQDLARAGGTCEPASGQNQPPIPAGWSQVIAEYDQLSSLYWSQDCLPPPFGPESCEEYTTDLAG